MPEKGSGSEGYTLAKAGNVFDIYNLREILNQTKCTD